MIRRFILDGDGAAAAAKEPCGKVDSDQEVVIFNCPYFIERGVRSAANRNSSDDIDGNKPCRESGKRESKSDGPSKTHDKRL
jgi:hypothetical protein